MPGSNIPSAIQSQLERIDPSATSFSGRLPRITASPSGKVYYAKLGASNEIEQFSGEEACLRVFEEIAPGLAPTVLAQGVDESSGQPYMISEYLDVNSGLTNNSKDELAKRLALDVHGHTSENGMYGFDVPTFCGATRFKNTWCMTWKEAFGGMFESLLDRIEKEGTDRDLIVLGRQVTERVIPLLLGEHLDIRPSLLHGDLWSGNTGTLSDGSPVVYDPSSYYGHNEADLAIARIFGGFGSQFYSKYHSHRSKSEPVNQYEERMILYELFHYLNHTLLFGSGYVGQSKSHMKKLLRYANDSASGKA